MPKDHPFNLAYDNFVNVFGEEGNLLIIAVKDSSLFKKNNFNSWIELSQSFKNKKEVNNVIHVGNIPIISKDKIKKEFTVDSILNNSFKSDYKVEEFKNFDVTYQDLYIRRWCQMAGYWFQVLGFKLLCWSPMFHNPSLGTHASIVWFQR